MTMTVALPTSLLETTRYFADPDLCVQFVAQMRWPDGVQCPHCESKRVSYLKSRRIWKCMNKVCHKQFSAKTFSIFEDSAIPLDKWLTAVWMVVNCKNGISSYELARDLKVTQKSAWFMLHRVRLALKNKKWEKLGGDDGGPVEIDETYVGPTHKKMHRSRRAKLQTGIQGRFAGKTPVFGMLDRESRQVRAQVLPNLKRDQLQQAIFDGIEKGSTVYSDGWAGYDQLKTQQFLHETVNHVDEYVRGQVHTQGIENFWSLLKRGLKGTYVAVEPFHLDRYVDEQVFRFNNRATKDNPLTDLDRFALAVSQISGKRLTYAELTGRDEEPNREQQQPF